MSEKNNNTRTKAGAKLQPAMILIPLAWVVFLGGQSFAHGTISMVHLAIGTLCCLLVTRDSRWGRLFCAAYNVLLVISMYYQGSADKVWPALDIVSGLCFVIATIALFLPSNLAPTDRNRSITAL